MKGAVLAVVLAVLLSLSLAGCSGGKKKQKDGDVIPEGIRREDLERAELLVSEFPLRYSFAGQQQLDPVRVYFNGTFGPGDGLTGVEFPTDEGPIDFGSLLKVFDISDRVAVGQPAEIRLELKWIGDPGRAGDLDIYVNVPGTNDAYSPGRVDESFNYNVGTKVRVANAVHVEGQPFEVGIQLNNGRIVHPDGMQYSLQVDLVYAKDVLAPGVPYVLTVPPNATQLIFESEPLAGDEHIQSEFMIVDAADKLVRHVTHNDIGSETLGIPVREPGDYIVYAHSMHGGFLRIESDVPNPTHATKTLKMKATEVAVHSGAPAPGTFAEMGSGAANTYGKTVPFEVAGNHPLDVVFRMGGSVASGAMNVTGPLGWLGTAYAVANHMDGGDRVGNAEAITIDRSTLTTGSYTVGVVANGPDMAMSLQVLTYER